MLEARGLEQIGEVVEAIWCYETILRDPLITEQLPMLRAASLGLGLLLISESRTSDDALRIERLLNRAIKVLGIGVTHHQGDGALILTLAEAHSLRFGFNGQAQDLLAANMLIDTMMERAETIAPALLDHAKKLRTHLATGSKTDR